MISELTQLEQLERLEKEQEDVESQKLDRMLAPSLWLFRAQGFAVGALLTGIV